MTKSQIKSYVAAAVVMLATMDAATLNLLSELLSPGWAKGVRLAVIFAGIVYSGRQQSWNTNHVSLPRAEAEALVSNTSAPADPVVRKATARVRKQTGEK